MKKFIIMILVIGGIFTSYNIVSSTNSNTSIDTIMVDSIGTTIVDSVSTDTTILSKY